MQVMKTRVRKSGIILLLSRTVKGYKNEIAYCVVMLILSSTVVVISSQVRYGSIRQSSVSPRTHCDGIPSALVWPSPRRTPSSPFPYPSDRPPSGHRPGRRQARQTHILQKGLRLAKIPDLRRLWQTECARIFKLNSISSK